MPLMFICLWRELFNGGVVTALVEIKGTRQPQVQSVRTKLFILLKMSGHRVKGVRQARQENLLLSTSAYSHLMYCGLRV